MLDFNIRNDIEDEKETKLNKRKPSIFEFKDICIIGRLPRQRSAFYDWCLRNNVNVSWKCDQNTTVLLYGKLPQNTPITTRKQYKDAMLHKVPVIDISTLKEYPFAKDYPVV